MVLSHDLLEGNFLRCGLLSDCILLDGYPTKYISYITRNHRWVRGDWQIARWIKSKKLNAISKFKIFDNLRRSLIKVAAIILIIFSALTNNYWLFGFSLGSISIVFLLDIINFFIFKESNKKFSKDLTMNTINLIKIFLNIILLPYESWENLNAIIKSFYRMAKKKKLLEWVTAEDRREES